MKLAFQQAFPASPDRVAALLRNQEFLEDVAEHAGATQHSSRIRDRVTELDMSIPSPERVQSVIGSTVSMSLVMEFQDAGPDGVVPGNVRVTVPGMPVEAYADGRLTPRGDQTIGEYEGELKVRIPLFGKKVEAQIEPFVVAAFEGIERRANEWLTR